jgi:flavin-dependent dehydrogenase
MPMFDVIVVGARCAGAPTAMLLARTTLAFRMKALGIKRPRA